jgi:hypothetical protein
LRTLLGDNVAACVREAHRVSGRAPLDPAAVVKKRSGSR